MEEKTVSFVFRGSPEALERLHDRIIGATNIIENLHGLKIEMVGPFDEETEDGPQTPESEERR